MAYSCVKVQFEIGHESSLRSEVTREGFTHDWQVYVRGLDNAEIHHFVEKVVFNLHESFPKPKRVVKEPPYEVRESGYASFTFPIEVYLKNKEEPRKLEFMYDLSLNTSSPVRQSQKEKRVFNNPSEEFRRKLIRGGGVGVGSDLLPLIDNNSHNSEDKMLSKKSSSESSKKHKSKESTKPEEVRTSNQFADLFGTPIKTAKMSPKEHIKRTSESKHSSESKVSSKFKHSPHKEKDRETNRKDLLITKSGKDKDRERSRDKEKSLEKNLKRPASPLLTGPPTKIIKEEPKILRHDESKEREKLKRSPTEIQVKSEKKDKKKDKKSRDEKDKKDRHKEHESRKEVPAQLPVVEKVDKVSPVERIDKIKPEFKDFKEIFKKSPKHVKDERSKEKPDKDKIETSEKQRHKHKKKDKNKKDERESKEKPAKKVDKPTVPPPPVPKEPSPPPQPLPTKSRIRSPSPKMDPLSALMSELPSSDKGSDSESSSNEDSRSIDKVRMLTPPPPSPPRSPTPERVRDEKCLKEKLKRKDKRNSLKDEDSSRKKKRKTRDKEDVIPERLPKPRVEDEPKLVKQELVEEDVEERLSDLSPESPPPRDEEEITRSRSPTPPTKFTEEYVTELKNLQQKIMTLEDNAELQRVVQVIAETGQYEITKKTFDFDLCALDKSTVKRLQDLFFATS